VKRRSGDESRQDVPEQIDPKQAVGKRRGRKASHAEHWTKATVVLLDRQIVFLDRLVSDIRGGSGAAITRAHVIRALVDALAASDVDLTTCRSEADLQTVLTQRLRSGQQRG
jgi:hypothetical protein